MSFLAMIVALVMLQAGAGITAVQRDQWFRSLRSFVGGFGLSPATATVVSVAIAMAVSGVIFGATEPVLFGLLWIVGSVIVLLYSFGRADCEGSADQYRSYCHSGDFEAAYLYAQSQWGLERAAEQLTTPQAVHNAIQKELLYGGYQRWFPVLFYFLLLGPAGALGYRLLQLGLGETCAETPDGQAARLLYYADWLPVRLLAAGFVLAGDFLNSREALLSTVSDFEVDPRTVLLSVGRAANGHIESQPGGDSFATAAAAEVSDLRSLLTRGAGAWVIVVSLVVLFS